MGVFVSCAASLACSVCPRWGVIVAAAGSSVFIFGPVTWGEMDGAVLCMSSIRFTLDVLDLVFMDGAGDGEMGGDGESSPAIVGIGRVCPSVWYVLQEGVAPFCV